jgi:hypothetical protein
MTQGMAMSDTRNSLPSWTAEVARFLSEFTDLTTSAVLSLTAAQGPTPADTLDRERLQNLANSIHSLEERMRSAEGPRCSEQSCAISNVAAAVERVVSVDHTLRSEGLSFDQIVPIHLVEELAGGLLVAAYCALDAMAVECDGCEPGRQSTLVASFARFILEYSGYHLEEAKAAQRKKSAPRLAAAMRYIRQLVGEIREAGMALRDEASKVTPEPETSKPVTPHEERPKRWSRLPLFHGTSTIRMQTILAEGILYKM